MTLRERIRARGTRLGNLLKGWVTYLLLICAALDSCLEWAGAIPDGWAPNWVKPTLVIAGLVSRVTGHLSVDKTKLEKKDEA